MPKKVVKSEAQLRREMLAKREERLKQSKLTTTSAYYRKYYNGRAREDKGRK